MFGDAKIFGAASLGKNRREKQQQGSPSPTTQLQHTRSRAPEKRLATTSILPGWICNASYPFHHSAFGSYPKTEKSRIWRCAYEGVGKDGQIRAGWHHSLRAGAQSQSPREHATHAGARNLQAGRHCHSVSARECHPPHNNSRVTLGRVGKK